MLFPRVAPAVDKPAERPLAASVVTVHARLAQTVYQPQRFLSPETRVMRERHILA
jgi:hypothetical protein